MKLSTIDKFFAKRMIPLVLIKGDGYFYFVYDDVEKNIFATRSVYVYRLNQLTFDQWIEEAGIIIREVEEEISDREINKKI